MRYFKLYRNFVKNQFHRETMYRFHFFVSLFTVVLGYVSNILFFTFLYHSGIESISGWSKYQIYVLLATVWIVDSIFGGVFFFNLIRIPMQVKRYDLDGLLLKPLNPIFVLTMRQFNFGLFSGAFFGLVFLIYAVVQGGFFIGITTIISYALGVVCSVLLLFSILFIMVTFSLRFVRIQGLIQMFWTMMEVGKNPYSIYPMALRTIFTFFVPAIVIYNFPSQIVLDSHYLGSLTQGEALLITVLVTFLWLWIAVKYFKRSLKYYYS